MNRRVVFASVLIAAASQFGLRVSVAAPKESARWEGSLPEVVRDSEAWGTLLQTLIKAGDSYGALAAASRMLALFQDLPTKERAYRAVVDLIDQGYPGPARDVFVAGDIEPRGEDRFVGSYALYKYLLNHEKGLERWARQYDQQLDHEHFPKYRFYLALAAYSDGRAAEAETLLKQVLTEVSGVHGAALARKASRTLARLYFEQGRYEPALGIYEGFLLRMNPVQPSDWLEASWSLYHLKRYSEALGMLYNLESKAGNSRILLEKYTLRALVYRQLCALENAEAMSTGFERDFGATLNGLKRGETARRFDALTRVETPSSKEFDSVALVLEAVRAESKKLSALPQGQRALAEYLYTSETRMLEKRQASLAEAAYAAGARELVSTQERLRFLKYDVARERFNPDAVFAGSSREEKTSKLPVDSVDGQPVPFVFHWPKSDGFWRDERLHFKGVAKQQCLN